MKNCFGESQKHKFFSVITRKLCTKNERLCAFLLTFSILCILCIPVCGLLPSLEEAAIYDRVIRLHVLADSDSEKEQALKLKVRDGILELVNELIVGCEDVREAEKRLRGSIGLIKAAATDVLRDEGSTHSVEVSLTREKYPTREYGDVTLPAGEYRSLRVMIGSAKGANWWCVLFPQLCVLPASAVGQPVRVIGDSDGSLEVGLTAGQIELITGKSPRTVIKFRMLEWLESLK